MSHFPIKDTVKRIKSISPMEKILPINNGRLEVKITGKDLYSDINSFLPSPDIIDYLFDISTHTDVLDKLSIVVDDEVDFKRAKETYITYLLVLAKKTLKELRVYTRKILGFLIFGGAVLVLSYFLEGRFQRVFFDSVNIIGGFSIWEAADLFFFARWEKRKELVSIVKLLEADWIQRDIS